MMVPSDAFSNSSSRAQLGVARSVILCHTNAFRCGALGDDCSKHSTVTDLLEPPRKSFLEPQDLAIPLPDFGVPLSSLSLPFSTRTRLRILLNTTGTSSPGP